MDIIKIEKVILSILIAPPFANIVEILEFRYLISI